MRRNKKIYKFRQQSQNMQCLFALDCKAILQLTPSGAL